MKKRLLLNVVVGFVVLMVAVGSIYAETFEHNKTGLQFDLPAGWSYEHEGDLFMATSPDENVLLIFFAGRTRKSNDFMDTMAAELDGIIDDVEFSSDAQEERINGLTQVYIEGTGFYGDEEVELDLTMVVGARKSLVVIALGAIDRIQNTVDDIYASIRR